MDFYEIFFFFSSLFPLFYFERVVGMLPRFGAKNVNTMLPACCCKLLLLLLVLLVLQMLQLLQSCCAAVAVRT